MHAVVLQGTVCLLAFRETLSAVIYNSVTKFQTLCYALVLLSWADLPQIYLSAIIKVKAEGFR